MHVSKISKMKKKTGYSKIRLLFSNCVFSCWGTFFSLKNSFLTFEYIRFPGHCRNSRARFFVHCCRADGLHTSMAIPGVFRYPQICPLTPFLKIWPSVFRQNGSVSNVIRNGNVQIYRWF